MKLPETYTQNFYLTVMPSGNLSLLTWRVADDDKDGYVCLGKHEITVNVPQEDPTMKIVACLKAAISSVRAEAEITSQALEDKIQKLLALPNPDSHIDSDCDIPF